MPRLLYECDNFRVCGRGTAKPGLCDACKEEAKQLDHALQKEARLDNQLASLERKPGRPKWRQS